MSDPVTRLKNALADRYTIEHELGAGGMATVYLARDLKHDRKVAVKVLRPELAAVLGGDRFLNEVKVTANLQHPHILQLYDSGHTDEFLYYVMPYVEGETLRDKLSREKQLGVEETIEIAKAVASALGFAHRKGVVHRDIKPENILLQDGVALVADFGIALAVNTAGGDRLTETGFSLGTPAYMSPEQVAGERNIDGRSDVYALGCVTYEMLAGDPPFVASTVQAVMAKHMTDPAPPVTTPRPGASPAAAAAIAKALEKVPADRFPTPGAFAAALTAPIEAMDGPKSIVVLPFANVSPDPDNEYFSDGLTEEIISDLSKVHVLRVISRNSAMRLKGTDKDTRTIGRELNVQYVLEGSVRRAGSAVRITAQLIDCETDVQLWSDKYSGTTDDVFEMQERLSRTIVDALELELNPDEDRRIAERPIEDPRAQESFQRARYESWRFNEQAADNALRLIDNAIAVVGESEVLYGAKGLVYFHCVSGGIRLHEDCLARAEEYAQKILTLRPASPYGEFLVGAIEVRRGNVQNGIRVLKRSLDAEPSNPDALLWLCYAYLTAGKPVSARPVIDRLLAIDPLTPLNYCMAGWAEFCEGDFDAALPLYRKVFEMDPEGSLGRLLYVMALGYCDHTDEAARIVDLLVQDTPSAVITLGGQFLVTAMKGERESAMQYATPELLEVARTQDFLSKLLAEGFALIGQQDRACDWLENAMRLGMVDYPFFTKHDPFLARLHGFPPFESLAEEVKRRWEAMEV